MHRLEGYISIKDRATESAEIDELKRTVGDLSSQQRQLLEEIHSLREKPSENAQKLKQDEGPPARQ